MSLKYPEKVFARMIRIVNGEEIFLFRKDTQIQFGSSSKVLGIAIMTNPGSFSFKNSKEWNDFQKGNTVYSVFEAYDKPDLTMQNLIQVIREAYKRVGLREPNGIVRIYNLSSIVESKKENVEPKHQKALQLLDKSSCYETHLLKELFLTNEYEFVRACSEFNFVIMGFADKVFASKVSALTTWKESPAICKKVVYAKDDIGRLSHPRRWRTEGYLMDKAIEGLSDVLVSKSNIENKKGFTFLKWNGKYGSEAKFVVRDNENNLQSIFVPGRVQDIVWTSADLANVAELEEWSSFEKETVDDLDLVAF
ncbi:hypothetical protein FQP34_04870 [Peribacillus simplex]|uniref:Uncharacterized protein n=1 Tax=Peribacillus simplex TaxID=1478 RepID=A0A8B5Y2I4_9BACI|nr:hypothetical protein [Peribacillus simplex]TVX82917.1 hypothetical protein FQP34_04870 [Peribacillus simplex]